MIARHPIPRFAPARRAGLRRGSLYIVVFGVTMLVTVMGMAALLTTRLTARESGASIDWEEAGTLAQSAVEHALSYLNAQAAANPTTWRGNFTSFVHGNAAAFTQSMGRGTWSWKVVDPVDGNFSNNYQDPFKLYGVGIVNNSTRVFSVQVVPGGTPLAVLQDGLAVGGNLTINGSSAISSGSPTTNAPTGWTPALASNSTLTLNSPVYGNIVAYTKAGSSSATGTTTTSVTQTMPSSGIYNLYLPKAVAITWASLGGGSSATINTATISPTTNPYGSASPDGVYSIVVPSGDSLTIQSTQFTGTLLISMTGGTLNLTGPNRWQSNRPEYPALIVTASGATVNITGSATWLSTSNGDVQPRYAGLFHIIGSTNTINISSNAFIYGSLLADGTVSTSNQTAFISNPALYSSPPVGYGAGPQLMIVPGSWIWDSPP